MSQMLESDRLEQVRRRLAVGSSAIAGVGILFLVVVIVIDVVQRRRGVTGVGSIDLTDFILPIVAYVGMASAEVAGTHIRVPLVTGMLPSRIANLCRVTGQLISVLLLAWLACGVRTKTLSMYEGGDFKAGLYHLPIWPAYAAILVGVLCFLLVVALGLARNIKELSSGGTVDGAELESIP